MNAFHRNKLMGASRVALVVAALLPAPKGSLAASAVTRAVIGAGGGPAAGVTIAARGTVGQPLAGGGSGPTIRIQAGWWLPATGTATDVPGDATLPSVFRAYPNQPNPFNPRTMLAFDLPAPAAQVRLRLYDLQGRLVASLVDGPLPAGRHAVAWNGVDDSGRAVASGVYVSVLETPLGRASGKLTLVR